MSAAQAAGVRPARCIDACHVYRLGGIDLRRLWMGQLVACCSSSMQFFSGHSLVNTTVGQLFVKGHGTA